jgi:NTP pyrophosphatase (non-canonical NTP hydrolase)
MHFNQYQLKTTETAVYREHPHLQIVYPTMGLPGEAGEVANKIKKVYRDKDGHFSQEDRNAIAKEIGGVLWYCAALATDLGLKLDDIAKENLKQLRSRLQRGTIAGDGDDR